MEIEEIEARLRDLAAGIAHQEQIIQELERDGHSAIGAKTMLHLLEEERLALSQRPGSQS